MKKPAVSIIVSLLVLLTPVVSSAQQLREPTGLPPCLPGNDVFLFANWPCDPNAPVPPVPPPPSEPPVSTLPPCAPGNNVFLFGNWPCDPSRPYVPPQPTNPPCRPIIPYTTEPLSPYYPPPCSTPTLPPCPRCPKTGNASCRYFVSCQPPTAPQPPCHWWMLRCILK